MKGIPGAWQAILENGSWVIRDNEGRKIAVVEKGKDAKANAQMIATSPYVLEALKGLVALVGDEDLDTSACPYGAQTMDRRISRSAPERKGQRQ